jgi:hypothetical protein
MTMLGGCRWKAPEGLDFFVIAGMGKICGNGEGIKSKNSDWE